jgi:hypothetical protein
VSGPTVSAPTFHMFLCASDVGVRMTSECEALGNVKANLPIAVDRFIKIALV